MSGKAGGSGSGGFASGDNGSHTGPSRENSLSYGGGKFETESAGVEYGLSERSTLNVDESEPSINYTRDPVTGNATERRDIGTADNESISGKGKSFELGTF